MPARWFTLIVCLLIAVSLGAPRSSLAQAAPPPTPEQLDAPTGGTRYLTIPAAAFQPAAEDQNYQIHGRYLIHFGQGGQNFPGTYFAPVTLPQGALITKVTYFWKDPGAPGDTSATLYRALRWTDNFQPVAGVPSSYDLFPPSFGSTSSTPQHFSINEPINNLAYIYYIHMSISGGGQTWSCAFQIEYTEPAATPTSGVVTIPPASYTPFSDGHDYYNNGWNVDAFGGPANLFGRAWYFAPVTLPDGATVTGLSFQWQRKINTNQTASAILYRTFLSNDDYIHMATATSTTGSGPFTGSTFNTAISNAQVLNLLFTYWLVIDMPANNPPEVEARDVFVQYSLPEPYNYVLAIPAAAFQPYENGYDFENHGRHIEHKHGPGNNTANGWYLAPVNLPDGAIINHMDFNWIEKSGVAGVARLQRTQLNVGNYTELGTIFTSTGSSTPTGGAGSDSSILGGAVDNSRYAYWVVVDIPASATGSLVEPSQVRLFYSTPIFLPLIKK